MTVAPSLIMSDVIRPGTPVVITSSGVARIGKLVGHK